MRKRPAIFWFLEQKCRRPNHYSPESLPPLGQRFATRWDLPAKILTPSRPAWAVTATTYCSSRENTVLFSKVIGLVCAWTTLPCSTINICPISMAVSKVTERVMAKERLIIMDSSCKENSSAGAEVRINSPILHQPARGYPCCRGKIRFMESGVIL